jgi:hypothetical protein
LNRVAGLFADRYHDNYYNNPISSGNISRAENAEIVSQSGIPNPLIHTPFALARWHNDGC